MHQLMRGTMHEAFNVSDEQLSRLIECDSTAQHDQSTMIDGKYL